MNKYQKIHYKINEQRNSLLLENNKLKNKIKNINEKFKNILNNKKIMLTISIVTIYMIIKKYKKINIFFKKVIKIWNYWKLIKFIYKSF